MKLMMFETGAGTALGAVDEGQVINLTAADPGLPATLMELIAGGPQAKDRAKAVAENAPASARLELSGVTASLPITRPEKFICVGLNLSLIHI